MRFTDVLWWCQLERVLRLVLVRQRLPSLHASHCRPPNSVLVSNFVSRFSWFQQPRHAKRHQLHSGLTSFRLCLSLYPPPLSATLAQGLPKRQIPDVDAAPLAVQQSQKLRPRTVLLQIGNLDDGPHRMWFRLCSSLGTLFRSISLHARPSTPLVLHLPVWQVPGLDKPHGDDLQVVADVHARPLRLGRLYNQQPAVPRLPVGPVPEPVCLLVLFWQQHGKFSCFYVVTR